MGGDVTRWIDSGGGPLVLLSRRLAELWNGYHGHYDAACGVSTILGVVDVEINEEAVRAVVIWDEPLSTTYLSDSGVIVQWLYGRNEQLVLSSVMDSLADANWEEEVFLDVDEELCLFDAASPWEELEEAELLVISVEAGRYRLRVANVILDEAHAIRIHQLLLEPGMP